MDRSLICWKSMTFLKQPQNIQNKSDKTIGKLPILFPNYCLDKETTNSRNTENVGITIK